MKPKGEVALKKLNSTSVKFGPSQPKITEFLTSSDTIQRVTTGIQATLSLIAVQNCRASEMSLKPEARRR